MPAAGRPCSCGGVRGYSIMAALAASFSRPYRARPQALLDRMRGPSRQRVDIF